ncbi:MAG: hypothetical protein SNJ80_09790 [Anaerolinea sp.]
MQLYLDERLIAEQVTEQELDEVLRHLSPDHHYAITLIDEGVGFMNASGNPERGYEIHYSDEPTGITMTSTNKELRPITMRRMFIQYLNHDLSWRHAVSWVDQRQPPLTPEDKRKSRRSMFTALALLLWFTVGWIPILYYSNDIIDALMFVPYCRAYDTGKPFTAYNTGGTSSANGLVRTVVLGSCIYGDGTAVPFDVVIGDAGRANLMQMVANALTVALPLLAIGVFWGLLMLILRVTDPNRKGRKTA